MENKKPVLNFDEVYSENGFSLLHNLFKDLYKYEKAIFTDDPILSEMQQMYPCFAA